MDVVYLDNNATTRPTAEVTAAVLEAHESLWANPSSVHRLGQAVRQRLELARASTAKLIGARPRELVLTSGGTESADLALRGLLAALSRRVGRADAGGAANVGDGGGGGEGGGGVGGVALLVAATEHAAVRELAEAVEAEGRPGRRVVWLGLDASGRVDVPGLREALAEVAARGEAGVVSVMWANNETGLITPMAEVSAAVAEARAAMTERGARRGVWLHTDATQAVGKLPVDVAGAGVDLLSFAGHKFHGPKGVGGLWARRGVGLSPQQRGGPQEMERRGGTENVPGALGMGVAAEQAAAWLADTQAMAGQAALRDRLEAKVAEGMRAAGLAESLGPVINGTGAGVAAGQGGGGAGGGRLWNTSNLGFRGLEAEAILLGLSERGVCGSAGAACSSGSLEPSPVLRAMGVEEAVAHGSVRLSLSRLTREDEVDRAAEALVSVVGRLARVMPV